MVSFTRGISPHRRGTHGKGWLKGGGYPVEPEGKVTWMCFQLESKFLLLDKMQTTKIGRFGADF